MSMKAQRGGRAVAPTHFQTWRQNGMDGRRHSADVVPPERTPVPIVQDTRSPWGQSGRVRNISFPPGFDARTVQSVTSRCIDCINPLTPNDPYGGRTAPLTSKRCILYMYSTNIGTEYFKHWYILSVSFSSKCSLFHNSNIFGSCFIHILYTGCAKI